jgi:hypothetical protein
MDEIEAETPAPRKGRGWVWVVLFVLAIAALVGYGQASRSGLDSRAHKVEARAAHATIDVSVPEKQLPKQIEDKIGAHVSRFDSAPGRAHLVSVEVSYIGRSKQLLFVLDSSGHLLR